MRKFCLVVKYPVFVNIRRVFFAFLTLFHCLAKYEHAPKQSSYIYNENLRATFNSLFQAN